MSASLIIAVLEDNDVLRELTVAALERYGHRVFGVYDAEDLDEAMATREIDLLVLDLNLPGEDGLSVAKRLKAAKPHLYIVMTTAKGSIEDRVAGYECGADIYLPKPVSEDELIAAVAGLARRIEQGRGQADTLRLIVVDQLLIGTSNVRLSATDCVLLKTLAQAPDRRVETWKLLEATQRQLNESTKASLEVQLVNLRKKITNAGYEQSAIRAIRNEGYQLLCRIIVE